MSSPRGILTLEELRTKVGDGTVDTVILAFPDPYGRLFGKRIDAGFFVESAPAPTPATTCSPSTWTWSRSRGTSTPTGRRATGICT